MAQNDRSDQYEVVEFPAILEVRNKKTRKHVQKPLWPEFFDLEALLRTKASMPTFQWNAQYQQQPTAEEARLLNESGGTVGTRQPPSCEYLIMSLGRSGRDTQPCRLHSTYYMGCFLERRDECVQYYIVK